MMSSNGDVKDGVINPRILILLLSARGALQSLNGQN